MKRWMSVITVMLLVGLGATSVHATDEAVGGCENSGSTSVKVLATTVKHYTNHDLVGSGGTFESAPLFETSVRTSRGACIIATLSALARPNDNWVVFQALVDGQPMYGHISSDEFFTDMGYSQTAALVQPPALLVGDPEVGDKNLFRMLSYTFYMAVAPGTHTVKVKWAGCCTTIGPNNVNTFEIGRASLLIHYK
jgi:hypothetical protein